MTTSQHAPDDTAVAAVIRLRDQSPRRGNAGSLKSVVSAGSILSVGSAGSILSVGSAGSILSVGSTGSMLSIGSVGSMLSIGSVGSILSRGSRRKILCIDDEPMTTPQRVGHVGLVLTIVGALAGLATFVTRRRSTPT